MSSTDTGAFETTLAERGYTVVRRSLAPSEGFGDHDHDYDVWGMVTEGEFRITVDGDTTSYTAGREFRLDAGRTHTEQAGPQGATLVVGRMYR